MRGSAMWESLGRHCITSDVRAVCEAANECGVDDILLYDGHCAGSPEYNVILDALPDNVRVFDTPDRCFLWRRIRGQAAQRPFGLITVGQHARYGEADAYLAHTIQTPPIRSLWLNGKPIAEIGLCAYSFCGTRFIANVGCAASMAEALEISPAVSCLPVKDKRRDWLPGPDETFGIIRTRVIEAIQYIGRKEPIMIDEPCVFRMEVTPGYRFEPPEQMAWKGRFLEYEALWEAPSVEIGIELLDYVRAQITTSRHARAELPADQG